ncbi:MAG: hypothetical protein ACJAUP_003823 [Cellvibrionaceae bacterium]|jgi:hypothetical protein
MEVQARLMVYRIATGPQRGRKLLTLQAGVMAEAYKSMESELLIVSLTIL